MRNVAAVLVAIGLCACAAPAARATEPFAKVGTYAAQWLVFPRGVRNIGMGATGVSDVSGLSTGYFNPACMAWSDATTLLGSYEDMYASLSISEFMLTSPIPFRADSTAGAWHFGGSFGYARLGMDPQTERTIFLPEGTGRTFDASDWLLSAAGATSWTHGAFSIGAGGAAKFLRQNLANNSADGWSFDVGTIAAFPIDLGDGALVRPRAGYAVLNLDNGISFDGRTSYVATENRTGFGFDLETPHVMLAKRSVPAVGFSLDYEHIDRDGSSAPDYSAGFEISVLSVAHVRYGVIDNDFTTFGLGTGWDYGHVLFRLDYAHTAPSDHLFDYGISYDRDTVGGLIGVRW